ncbi:MAG: hypothetical protein GF329_22285 [Candidatus Lokiarchaeota archaeon]|nr:hypothetical protein [Candidatus Lokiarchaeota archaeon]
MLSTLGWITGIIAIIKLLIGVGFGLFLIHRSRKLNAKLLFYLGIAIIFLDNMDYDFGQYGLLGYMWTPLVSLFSFYIGAELRLKN